MQLIDKELIFWLLLILVLHLVGFLYKIDLVVLLVVGLPFLIYRWIFGKWSTLKELRSALLLAVPFLLTASMPTRFLDSGRYYEQSVRWFQNGIPAGLANFDLYLVQMSAAHSLEAIGNVFLQTSQNDLTPILSMLLFVFGINHWKVLNFGRGLMLALIYFFLVQFAQCSSPDLLVSAVVFAAFCAGKGFSSGSRLYWMLVMVALPFIKLSAVGISLIIFIRLILEGHKFSCWLFFGGCLFLMKMAWLSGWLPLFGSLHVPWGIPLEAISQLQGDVSILNYSEDYNPYLISSLRMRLLDTLFGLLFFCVIGCSYIMKRLDLVDFVLFFIVFVAWVFVIPQGRILLPYIIFAILVTSSKKGGEHYRYSTNWIAYGTFIMGTLIVLPNWKNLSSSPRVQHFFDYGGVSNVGWFKPKALWSPETEERTLQDLSYHVPIEPFECFDAEFPCNAKILKYYGGDSVYLPVYNSDRNYFSYQSLIIGENTQEMLDSLNVLPQIELKQSKTQKK